MELDLNVITDAPLPGTELATAEGTWVQLAKQGSFADPRYGKFKITQADFDKWLANFAALWSPASGREGIPIDVDHGPEKRGETESAGWVKELEQRGNQLWGLVHWNDLGRELVSARRYVYLSPSYAHDFKDEEGRSHGTAMVGVGLTNRPFLRMATVTLSAAPLVAEAVAADRSIAPGDMAFLDDLKAKLAERGITLAADATEADALTALDGLGVPEQTADTRTLAARLQAEGMVVLSATDHTKLQGQAAAGQAAADQLRAQRFDSAFDKALSEGRITPAQKERFAASYSADADATLAILEELPQVLSLDAPAGHSGQGVAAGVSQGQAGAAAAEGNELDEDRAKVADRTEQILAAEPDTDYLAAAERAAAELGVSL